jgi:hypothetical protein
MKRGVSQQIPMKFRGSLGKYFKNLHSGKLENLEEMDKFLDTYDLLKFKRENINHVNRSIMSYER